MFSAIRQTLTPILICLVFLGPIPAWLHKHAGLAEQCCEPSSNSHDQCNIFGSASASPKHLHSTRMQPSIGCETSSHKPSNRHRSCGCSKDSAFAGTQHLAQSGRWLGKPCVSAPQPSDHDCAHCMICQSLNSANGIWQASPVPSVGMKLVSIFSAIETLFLDGSSTTIASPRGPPVA